MSENNYNWVCFQCLYAIRQAKSFKNTPKCQSCGQDCVCVGYKLKIPKKSDKKGWVQLKKINREIRRQNLESQKRRKSDRVSFLINEIKRLGEKEENKDRTRLINRMKEELNQLIQ